MILWSTKGGEEGVDGRLPGWGDGGRMGQRFEGEGGLRGFRVVEKKIKDKIFALSTGSRYSLDIF